MTRQPALIFPTS